MKRHLYAIRARDGGPIKLGISNNPASRLAQLQTAHHAELELIATTPGTDIDERDMHRLFEQSRLRGEWFEDSPHLQEVLSTWEVPPPEPGEEWGSINGFYAKSQPSRVDEFLCWWRDNTDGTEVQGDLIRAFIDTACADALHHEGDRLIGPRGQPFFLLERSYMRKLHLHTGGDIIARMTATFETDSESEVHFMRRTPDDPMQRLREGVLCLYVYRRSRRLMLHAMQTARQFLAATHPGP